MTKIIIFIKQYNGYTSYYIDDSTSIPIEFPIQLPYSKDSEIKYLSSSSSKNHKFNISIIKKNDNNKDDQNQITSIDDISHITLSIIETISEKDNAINDNYKHWNHMLSKRSEDIIELKKDKNKLIERTENENTEDKENIDNRILSRVGQS